MIGGLSVAIILMLTTAWMGQRAGSSTREAVHSISEFYLGELAGRREQVIAPNLSNSILHIQSAIEIMDDEDLSDMAHLTAFLGKIKTLYKLDKFALVDEEELIYTSRGTEANLDEYGFDPASLREPEISIANLYSPRKKAIIAIPAEGVRFGRKAITAAFMEIDIHRMLEGLSLQTDENETTFCNLYYENGV